MRAMQAREMAAYNQWMNRNLYAVSAELSDAGLDLIPVPSEVIAMAPRDPAAPLIN